MAARTVRLWAPLAPATRWHLLDAEGRRLAMRLARQRVVRAAVEHQVALTGPERVRTGLLPGYRKPWVYLERQATDARVVGVA